MSTIFAHAGTKNQCMNYPLPSMLYSTTPELCVVALFGIVWCYIYIAKKITYAKSRQSFGVVWRRRTFMTDYAKERQSFGVLWRHMASFGVLWRQSLDLLFNAKQRQDIGVLWRTLA